MRKQNTVAQLASAGRVRKRLLRLIDNILKPLIQLEEDAENPGSNPSLAAYCRWADNLDDQFASAEHLVKEERAFSTQRI